MKCVLRSMGKRYDCKITQDETKLYFKTPFGLKGEIKAMKGAKWNKDQKIWTATRCPRNLFQLRTMMVEPVNENPYAWFERELIDLENVTRPLAGQQIDMLRRALTYHYQIIAADMGLGKSLFAIELVERVGGKWIIVGPRSALESIEEDRVKWDSLDQAQLMTYERFRIDKEEILKDVPTGIIFDECTALKTPNAITTRAAQEVTDKIREVHGMNGYVIAMSGTTVAKHPTDIWSQAEVVWPGFLREGTFKSFEARYAIVVMQEDLDGNKFPVREGWREHEVAKLPDRLDGLMTTYFKSEWLDLPPRHFETRVLPVSPRLKRVGQAICDAAPNTITALTSLRALSSGFQYKEADEDSDAPKNGERLLVETLCPKDDALREILAEEESRGRMITFAGFQGSIDRIKRICFEENWDVATVDGRGWICWAADGSQYKDKVMPFWRNNPRRTVLVGNPASCRFGLTLIEAKTIVVFDQGFSAEHRIQSLDRNYRMGQTEEVRVIDLIHLPVDALVLETLTENKRLEDLSLGRIREQLA